MGLSLLHIAIIAPYFMIICLMVIAPGPNSILVLHTTSESSRKAAMCNIVGIATGFYIHGMLVYFGTSALIAQYPTLLASIKILGASYLFYLGLKCWATQRLSTSLIASQQTLSHDSKHRLLRHHFYKGLLVNLLNPKISVFYLAIFPHIMAASLHHALRAMEGPNGPMASSPR